MAKSNTNQDKSDAENLPNGNEPVNINQDDAQSAHEDNEHEHNQSDDESSHESQEEDITVKETADLKSPEPGRKRNKDGSFRQPRGNTKSKGQTEKKVPAKRKAKADDNSSSKTLKKPLVARGAAKKNVAEATETSSDNENIADAKELKKKEQEKAKVAENETLAKLPWYREEIQKYFSFIMNRSFKWEDIPKDVKLEHRTGPAIKAELSRIINTMIGCYPKKADLLAIHTGKLVPSVEILKQNIKDVDKSTKHDLLAVESSPDMTTDAGQ